MYVYVLSAAHVSINSVGFLLFRLMAVRGYNGERVPFLMPLVTIAASRSPFSVIVSAVAF